MTSQVLLVAAVLPVLVPVGLWLVARPQRGLLVMAALLPFDGVLLLIPGGASVGAWKEALLLGTLLATLLAPPAALRRERTPVPSWVLPLVAMVALGLVSAVLVGGTVAVWGLKVSFFYALVPLVLWRCPFTARDRDHLVSILMATGAITAAVGLLQQALGPERLNELGFEYNTAIRFSGSLLRSFSTFTQPFSFGFFVTMVLLVCLPVAMADARRKRNQLFLLASPFLVLGMASSVVRGAALALAAGLLVLMAWRFRGLFHAFVPIGIAALFIPAPALAAYLSSSSLGQRTSGWTQILDLVVAAPFGNGIGTTGAAAEKSVELGVSPDEVLTVSGTQLYLPDNQYVKTVLELGPLGLWLLLLIGCAVVAAAATAARLTTGDDRAMAMGIAASVIGAGVGSLVSTYLEIFPLDFYFWLLAGVLTCFNPSPSTPSPSVPVAAASRPTSVSCSVP